MVQPRWRGFGIRLGRAIDRWPGGGQRAFADALRAHATRTAARLPTSYRTLVNYLNEETTPSVAWVEAAATVLRVPTESLLTGEEAKPAGDASSGFTISIGGSGAPRASMIMQLFVNRHPDLPMPARLMLFHFLNDYFAGDDNGWSFGADKSRRSRDIRRVLDDFYGPLFSRPSMNNAATMALAASLTAAAYVRLGIDLANPTRGEDA